MIHAVEAGRRMARILGAAFAGRSHQSKRGNRNRAPGAVWIQSHDTEGAGVVMAGPLVWNSVDLSDFDDQILSGSGVIMYDGIWYPSEAEAYMDLMARWDRAGITPAKQRAVGRASRASRGQPSHW